MAIKLSVIKYLFFKKVFDFLLLFILFGTTVSCQDNHHQINEKWLQDQKQVSSSTVLLNNKQGFVPIKDLEQKIASVNIGSANASTFDSLLNKYTTVASFSVSPTDSAFNNLDIDLTFYNTVIVEVARAALNEKSTFSFLYDIQRSKHLVLVIYRRADALALCDNINQPIIVTPEDSQVSADFIAQIIFGGVPAVARLGKTWSKHYRKNDGFVTAATRLHYTFPEDAGINISDLEHPVDSLVAAAIQGKAIPGAVVMVVKDGKVIFDKAYGTHTYEGMQADKISDIFDMASVTKVSASTMAVMRLYEQKKIALDSSFGYYFPPARNTNKSNIKIRDLLLHQSGIASGVVLPLLSTDFSADSSEAFPVKAGNNVFIRKNYYKDVILPRMLDVKVDTPKYVYSDLSMTYMKEVIESQSGTRLDEYVSKNFYFPLGMQSAGFNPLYRFDSARIVPTERDADFRKGLIHGYVHDPMAAKYGGVSGNAGLFASANDLAILYQMILNKGTYGGTKFFNSETIDLFTSKQSLISRRGLGFDRVDTSSEFGYPAKLASLQTYGHTGFTGTCFWVDPKYHLVFIFLSNRVYPKVNSTIYQLHTQANVLDAIYKAIIKSSGNTPLKE